MPRALMRATQALAAERFNAAFGYREQSGPKLADFVSPSQTIMVVESNSFNTDIRLTNVYWDGRHQMPVAAASIRLYMPDIFPR